MTANADMQEFWNGDAGHKWVRFQERMDASLEPFGRRAMAAAEIKSDERVLDIGCGCGATSLQLAGLVGAGGHVHGVDFSQPELARAEARRKSGSHENVKFEHADAQTVSTETAWYDVVFSRFGVMFFEDPVAAFTNFRRALKPGGRIAFMCWRPASDNEWVQIPLNAAKNHIPLPEPPEPGAPGPFAFSDDERVRGILEQAGFDGIGIEKHSENFIVKGSLDTAAEFFTQMGPASRAITNAECDEATMARIIADIRVALAPFEIAQGVALDTATWIVTARAP